MNKLLVVLLLTLVVGCSKELTKKIASDLKDKPVARLSGESVQFNDVVIFACMGIPNNRFLFNKDHSDICWIKDPSDYQQIVKQTEADLKGKFSGEATVFFTNCSPQIANIKYCQPSAARNF